jgi:hypothetical protein
MQPSELHPLLMRVINLVETPDNDSKELKQAANECNEVIMSLVDELLVFAYHKSETILSSIEVVKESKITTLFYLD